MICMGNHMRTERVHEPGGDVVANLEALGTNMRADVNVVIPGAKRIAFGQSANRLAGYPGNRAPPTGMDNRETPRRRNGDEQQAVGSVQQRRNAGHLDDHPVSSILGAQVRLLDTRRIRNAHEICPVHLVRNKKRRIRHACSLAHETTVALDGFKIISHMRSRVHARINPIAHAAVTPREKDAHAARVEQGIICKRNKTMRPHRERIENRKRKLGRNVHP